MQSALRNAGFRWFIATYLLAMMADNIEHVITYLVAYEKLHSQALGGFAVVSHWVPYLFGSVWVGSLNDRFDSRRIIQIGMALFMFAALGWGYCFVTDSLTIPRACGLLIIHGCAGVFWGTSSQMLLYDIVGPQLLPSAVRINATARSLAVLVGPLVGVGIMQLFGKTYGIFVDAVFYIPLLVWLVRAPFGRHFRGADQAGPKRGVKGFQDIAQTIRDVRPIPVLASMLVLAGAASFFIGNSYQAQMPTFAELLGRERGDFYYSMLLGADACGALVAGTLLETTRTLLPMRPRVAMTLSLFWAAALAGFAQCGSYPASLVLLFCAGFFELSFTSMTQALVQLNAPDAIRGRVLGLFNMTSLGLRAFSGGTVGLIGAAIGVQLSLAIAAGCFAATITTALLAMRKAQP
jgi:MFS family permease